jgi:cobalamin biosynthesis protein CobT
MRLTWRGARRLGSRPRSSRKLHRPATPLSPPRALMPLSGRRWPMSFEIEIEGDSEEAVALALLQMIARAEGKMDDDGELKGVDRAWILDAYTECLAAAYGMRGDDEDEEDEEDEEEEDEDEDDEEEDEEEDEDEEDEDADPTPPRR